MAEPVTMTAAAVVAAPAAAGAAATAPAAGGAAGGSAAAATPSAAAGSAPAYAMKAQGSGAGGLAANTPSDFDLGRFQRVLGCHDSAQIQPSGAGSDSLQQGSPDSSLLWRYDHGGTLKLDPQRPESGTRLMPEFGPKDPLLERTPEMRARAIEMPEMRIEGDLRSADRAGASKPSELPDTSANGSSDAPEIEVPQESGDDIGLDEFGDEPFDPDVFEDTPDGRAADGEEQPPDEPTPDERVKPQDIETTGDVHRYLEQHVAQEVHGGIDRLEEELGGYVDEGGSPLLATVGLTLLDVGGLSADALVGMTGIWRLGEGIASGTFGGVVEDVFRTADVVPAGKALTAGKSGVKVLVGAVGAGVKVKKGVKVAKQIKKAKKLKKTAAAMRRKQDQGLLTEQSMIELEKKGLGQYRDYLYAFTKKGDPMFPYLVARRLAMSKGMHAHHVVPQWLFRYGPKSLIGLKHYVPTVLLKAKDHSGIHSELEIFLKSNGIHYYKILTHAQQQKALKLLEKFYRQKGYSDLATAVETFRTQIFEQLK
jgi:hypothetical protein